MTKDQLPGQLFIPMHWNDYWASSAKVNRLIHATTDPISCQPALKSGTVQITKSTLNFFGFVVCRNKPNTDRLDYWAIAKARKGWRMEFALKNCPTDVTTWLNRFNQSDNALTANDTKQNSWRIAAFQELKLESFASLSDGPVPVSRSWATGLLGKSFENTQNRYRVLAGFPTDGTDDKGAIVCVCENVGLEQIRQCLNKNGKTVSDVGAETGAGTGCGSCRIEIKKISEQSTVKELSIA